MMNLAGDMDLIVFSSDKFGCEDLRTSDLMKEFSLKNRVFFFEQPILGDAKDPSYLIEKEDHDVCIIQPYLPAETSVFEQKYFLLDLIKGIFSKEEISHYSIWTDTPKAMPFIRRLSPEIIIYDCLRDYSRSAETLESELFQYADVVLTSGMINYPSVATERNLSVA